MTKNGDIIRIPPVHLLMGWAQQVKDYLHWIECFHGDFHEKCVPAAHGTIPKSRKLKSLQLASLIALGTDEAGIFVHIVQKVELPALVVMETADYIHRIEMGGALQRFDCIWIGSVYLYALKYLERSRPILCPYYERAAARFSLVTDHSTYADRTIEFLPYGQDA